MKGKGPELHTPGIGRKIITFDIYIPPGTPRLKELGTEL